MKTPMALRSSLRIARIILSGLLVLANILPNSLPLAARSNPIYSRLERLPVTPTLRAAGRQLLINRGRALAFDEQQGLLALSGTESAAPLAIAADGAGFLSVKQGARTWSSNPTSPHFAPVLAGATTRTVTQLWVDQTYITEATLTHWSTPAGLAVASAVPLSLKGKLQMGTILAVRAPQLTVTADLLAADLRLAGADWVSIAPAATLRASMRTQGGRIQVTGRLISSVGRLDATGEYGGAILLEGERLLQAGAIIVNGTLGGGGQVQMRFSHSYIATAHAITQANGVMGGQVRLDGGATARLYSSGQVQAVGRAGPGGDLLLLGRSIVLSAAGIDAGGRQGGGQVRVGGGVHGADPALPNASQVLIAPSTRIAADAGQAGNGGTLSVWAEERNEVHGSLSARGGRQRGNGGQIETSARQTLQATGDIHLDAPNGQAGQWQLDPRHITISAAREGRLPQFQLLDPSPNPDNWFGDYLLPLSNGNVVVADSSDNFAAQAAGAVYLFDGFTGALLSTLTGSAPNDGVGTGGVTALSNGNYVVSSRTWANGAIPNAGAVTWANGATGVAGIVSAANSLVGTHPDDIGSLRGVVALTNGNYVVNSPGWDNGTTPNAGAVTWGNGATGTVGAISAANSLVGTQANDQLGGAGVTVLSNGNYVVRSPDWDNGAIVNAGAVTWGNGTTGTVGAASAANSLVGSVTGDISGQGRVFALTNGNYVVLNPDWDNGAVPNAGAATWGNGATGAVGTIAAANSLVGSAPNEYVGSRGLVTLNNGNYVVLSPKVSNGGALNAGAVTWGNGATGVVGVVSAANSLVGSLPEDRVGDSGVVALSNGNYVVSSPLWDKGVTPDAGAVTWGNGTTGTRGLVTTENSLVGAQTKDYVGNGGVTALSNGHYVVCSYFWDNGAMPDVGAVTWANGTTSIVGTPSVANSLVGAQASDVVGNGGVTALRNGNYVVQSPAWDHGTIVNAGAVTWGNGTSGSIGVVSPVNSLVGSQPSDNVGSGVVALSNGNYVVYSYNWDNGQVVQAGAVTWGNGTTGVKGVVSVANSLVGSQAEDFVGGSGIVALRNGNYVVRNSYWDQGNTPNVGAVTWGDGSKGISGVVSAANSLVGAQANDLVGSSDETALHTALASARNPAATTDPTLASEAMIGVVPLAASVVDAQTDDYFGYGVMALRDGNYMVSSPAWDNGTTLNAGAITWVEGNSGRTLDQQNTISAQNSLIGSATNSTLHNIQENTLHNNFVSVLREGGSGRVIVTFTEPNQLTYRQAQQQAITVTPAFLARSLRDAVAVTLQANSDLTLNSPLQVTAANGIGGALTLQAGRTLALNANLVSADAPVTLVANDLLANGVVDAERDPGVATLVMASNTTLDAGTADVVIELRDGAGKRHAASGAINLQRVIAGSLTVNNLGLAANSDLLLGGPVITRGPQQYHTRNGVTTVAATLTTNDAPIAFAQSVVIQPGVTLNSGTGAVELVGTETQNFSAAGGTLGNLTHRGLGTLRLLGALTLGGTLRNLAGDFDANGQAMTVNRAAVFSDSLYRPDLGAQMFTGDFTLQLGATLRVDLNGVAMGQFTQLQVGGTTTLTAPGDPLGSTLQVVTGFTPAPNTSFVIIENDSNRPVVGTFANLVQGAVFAVGATNFQITYQGGDGNDVVLTVVETPPTVPVPVTQTIDFTPLADKLVGDLPFGLTATASSGLPVSFVTLTPNVCTVGVNEDTANLVTLLATGTCTLQASQTGNAVYKPAPSVTQSFAVKSSQKLDQTLSFDQLVDRTLGESPFVLSASTSSGLSVRFANNTPRICTVNGDTVTLMATGICSITATQEGNDLINPASPVTQTFRISSADDGRAQSVYLPVVAR